MATEAEVGSGGLQIGSPAREKKFLESGSTGRPLRLAKSDGIL